MHHQKHVVAVKLPSLECPLGLHGDAVELATVVHVHTECIVRSLASSTKLAIPSIDSIIVAFFA